MTVLLEYIVIMLYSLRPVLQLLLSTALNVVLLLLCVSCTLSVALFALFVLSALCILEVFLEERCFISLCTVFVTEVTVNLF